MSRYSTDDGIDAAPVAASFAPVRLETRAGRIMRRTPIIGEANTIRVERIDIDPDAIATDPIDPIEPIDEYPTITTIPNGGRFADREYPAIAAGLDIEDTGSDYYARRNAADVDGLTDDALWLRGIKAIIGEGGFAYRRGPYQRMPSGAFRRPYSTTASSERGTSR